MQKIFSDSANASFDTGSTEAPMMEPHPYFAAIEYACILWFIFEYVIKMIVSYNRKKTFFSLLNVIDLLAILPFLIEIAFIFVGINTDEMQDWKVGLFQFY